MKIFRPAVIVSSLLFICFLVGCDDDDGDKGDIVVPSELIDTNRIYATIDVYSHSDNSVYSSVQLTVDSAPAEDKPGDEYIQLNSDDQLWMTTDIVLDDIDLGNDLFSGLVDLDKVQELFTEEVRGYYSFAFFFFWSTLIPTHVHYNGNLKNVEEGADYTVSLLRDRMSDAKYSKVKMPLRFDITAPNDEEVISRSLDTIQVEWMPIENNVSIKASFDTSCRNGSEREHVVEMASDEGVFTVAAGEIDHASLSGDCNTTLTLVKTRVGVLDTAYKGGYITANQVKTLSFNTKD